MIYFSSLQAQELTELNTIQALRIKGELKAALEIAENSIRANKTASEKILLHLEMAKIHDRIGLHQNTRPVKLSLENIEAAYQLSVENYSILWAEVALERGRYFYRAELAKRKFDQATYYTNMAIKGAKESGNTVLEADAVHLSGLIYLQQNQLQKAKALFDKSLELDRIKGERAIFRGDYERHMGFVVYLSGDTLASVPYFERSLEHRKSAGAVDQCLFAARILGFTLLHCNRFEEAKSVLLYGFAIAELIDSPAGKARLGSAIGQLYEKQGLLNEARIAYTMTNKIARSIQYTSMINSTDEALKRIQ